MPMGLYGTGVSVRPRDDTHPMADAVGFIINERGAVAQNGDIIDDGHCEVQFVFPEDDEREGTTEVLPNDALRVVGC